MTSVNCSGVLPSASKPCAALNDKRIDEARQREIIGGYTIRLRTRSHIRMSVTEQLARFARNLENQPGMDGIFAAAGIETA